MAATKNLCALISLELHQKISEAKDQAGQTTSQYITALITEYFKLKESGGNIIMKNNNTRTLAFQISEELFQRIKAHLERETQRTGRKLTQREFVLDLIEQALAEAETGLETSLESAPVSPAETPEEPDEDEGQPGDKGPALSA